MSKLKQQTFSVLIIILFTTIVFNTASTSSALQLPESQGYINDFASIVAPRTEKQLETKLKNYEKQTGNEIAIVTVKSLEGLPPSDYAVRLFEKWKIGKADQDNGVLLLISLNDRKIRIEIGYGLEPELTDLEASNIITKHISPAFKNGDFNDGVLNGVQAIISSIKSNKLNKEPENDSATGQLDSDSIFGTIFVFLILLSALSAYLSRTSKWWTGGIIGTIFGGIIGFIFAAILGLIGFALLFGFIGFIFDYFLSKNNKDKPNRKNRWTHFWGRDDTYIPTDTFNSGTSGSDSGFDGFGGGESGGGGADGDF